MTEVDAGSRTLTTTDLGAPVGTVIGTSDWPGLHLVYEVHGQVEPCCVADILLRYHPADSL